MIYSRRKMDFVSTRPVYDVVPRLIFHFQNLENLSGKLETRHQLRSIFHAVSNEEREREREAPRSFFSIDNNAARSHARETAIARVYRSIIATDRRYYYYELLLFILGRGRMRF